MARARADAVTYKTVFNAIQERYKSFSQGTETGHEGMAGVTGDIADVKIGDLVSILRHIAANDDRRLDAARKSAISPLFEKIYLMESKEQGWNLRLHQFAPGGKAQGEEEMPHYHRWTLASKLLKGGYDNRNFREIPDSEATADEKLHKYRLGPAPAGASSRSMLHEGPVGMRITRDTLFHEGQVRHFPIALPHSVVDLSQHTGTGMTLAHTAKPVTDSSFTYRTSENLNSVPQEQSASPQEFIASLHSKVAFLQLISLRDALHNHLKEKDPRALTANEIRHLEDSSAPNYMETSLLPALAISNLAAREGAPSDEFSPETMKFLRDKLRKIDESSFADLIKANQQHIEKNYFSTEVSSWEQLRTMVEKK